MHPVAVVAVALTSLVVLTRPPLGRWRIGPAGAALMGVSVLALAGFVDAADAWRAVDALWPAGLGVASVMMMTACVSYVASLDLLAMTIERRSGSSTLVLFLVVFFGSWVTAGALNNDAAVVVNTALVASLLRRRFATRPDLAEPFLLAVFLGAGVAPLLMSNPMNLAVAHLAHIGFLEYAATMVPVSLVGALVTLAVLLALYGGRLKGHTHISARAVPITFEARAGLIIVAAVLVGYVAVSLASLPSWPVSVVGALLSAALVARRDRSVLQVIRGGVSLEVLLVLPLVFVFAAGLSRAGLVDALAPWLAHRGALQVGTVSAIGSALLNNHTMGLINVGVLVEQAAVGHREIFAALVGGDLGPRLLPFGSLAGLLWLEALRQQGLAVPLRRFVAVGAITGVPTLMAALLALRFF